MRALVPACVTWLTLSAAAAAGTPAEEAATVPYPFAASDYCATEHPDAFFERFQAGVGRGDIPDPSWRAQVAVRGRKPFVFGGGETRSLERRDLFLYEDSDRLLVSSFSDNDLFLFMGEATAALLAEHGDNFDFVAFWINFQADHQIGAAFYLGLENLTDGLGLNSFIRRPAFGVPGDNVEGWVMMWNVHNWAPGSGQDAGFTRLVLGQEFEHRWAMFLDPVAGGRVLQGDNGGCGRSSHWSFRVDGQGSGMEIAEWVGVSPAQRQNGTIRFNTDIEGVFSPTDLYLMGYLSPEEMDARNSEFRFMDDSNCFGNYNGPVFELTAGRIIQGNGARNPSSVDAQKHFRVGWIMVHLPESPPSTNEINRALGIMEQHQIDWYNGTLGVGTISASVRGSLGGDFDGDGDVDLTDYDSFGGCFSGAAGVSEAPGCGVFDDDLDGDVDLLDYGTFTRAFTGDCGVAFAVQPSDETACLGGPATLSVATDGVAFGFQWTHNGIPIGGATSSSLTIPSVSGNDVGEYRVTASGDCAMTHSEIAVLDLHAPPVVTVQPQSVGVCDAGSGAFSVEAAGVEPLSYQWQRNGANIPGATGSTLLVEDVGADDLGAYRCVVTDSCDIDVVSDAALLEFAGDVTITLQPTGAERCVGDTIGLFTGATGLATFQWFKDDVPIAGATSVFLFIVNASEADSGTYHADAIGPCETLATESAVVTVSVCGGAP